MFLYNFVETLFSVYLIMLFIRIIASWIPELSQYRLFQFICFYTDPYLNLFRNLIPPLGMIDISPMIAFFALSIIKSIVLSLLR